MTRVPLPAGRVPGPHPAGGFTLLELLVAITVLAMVSTIAWRGLDSLVATRARLVPQAEQIRTMLVSFGQIERDLAHAAHPGLFALRTPPVKVRTSGSGQTLQVLRLAPTAHPVGATRLQEVTWAVVDDTLVRRATPPQLSAPGGDDGDTVETARLLEGVRALRVRVWRGAEGWVVPAPAEADQPTPGVPVPGVEVEIERADGTRIRRVMLVG